MYLFNAEQEYREEDEVVEAKNDSSPIVTKQNTTSLGDKYEDFQKSGVPIFLKSPLSNTKIIQQLDADGVPITGIVHLQRESTTQEIVDSEDKSASNTNIGLSTTGQQEFQNNANASFEDAADDEDEIDFDAQ